MSQNISSVFVDTNVLIYSSLTASPFHAQAVQRLTDFHNQGTNLWISRQVLREYMATMTRPQTVTPAIPLTSLVSDIQTFSTSFNIAEDGPTVTDKWLVLLQQIPSKGKQIHDVNIVATMQTYNISHLLTHNTADFARFANLITIIPLVITTP